MTRSLAISSFVALVLGCSPALTDGAYACNDDTECPTGFRCGGGRCHNRAGTDCRQDVQCDDGSACTDDVCESGYCNHPPAANSDGLFCDDGVFCNGTDACRAGRCVGGTMPPCDACDEQSRSCAGCGQIGSACCAGATCNEGGRCNGATCEPCGMAGQGCCDTFPQCVDGNVCDLASGSPVCSACGGEGQPCCFGAIGGAAECGGGLECSFNTSLCVRCGDVGQPCCESGCRTGVCDDTSGVVGAEHCVEPHCDVPCPSGLVCVPIAGGGAACKSCGNASEVCCPPDNSCPGTLDTCFYGRCGGSVMPL